MNSLHDASTAMNAPERMTTDTEQLMHGIGRDARAAARVLALASTEQKNRALTAAAAALRRAVPEILADAHRLVPTLIGFLVLGAAFWKTRSIIVPTLLSAFAYGLAWKIINGL